MPMKHIRTIVVDDEPAARARIARLLEQDAEMELVAECRNRSTSSLSEESFSM